MPNDREEIEQLINRLDETGERLLRLVQWDSATLSRSYGEGKWTGRQLAAHLADCDLVLYYRFLKTVAEEGSPIVPFDQDRWAAELSYERHPLESILAMSHAVSVSLAVDLRNLSLEALERSSFHPERGRLTAWQIAQTLVNHRLHHLEQLRAIEEGKTWKSNSS